MPNETNTGRIPYAFSHLTHHAQRGGYAEDLDPACHAAGGMAQHVTVEQPHSGVVCDKGNAACFAASQQQCIAHRAVGAARQHLTEVHAVQMHRMGKGRVIAQLDLQCLPQSGAGQRVIRAP